MRASAWIPSGVDEACGNLLKQMTGFRTLRPQGLHGKSDRSYDGADSVVADEMTVTRRRVHWRWSWSPLGSAACRSPLCPARAPDQFLKRTPFNT
ncbi:hypothetical protein RR46_06075 [Papilio xuthus]|uniref:Uncharacterized protein n=1 Tax=Papilio xuthus TaxID=66420 RepID=A0A194Q8Q9_PAPXU|nr:hypothetical protein RR46_06075 [Papilio xuthus]